MAINVNAVKNKIRNELRQAPTPTQGTRNTTGSTVQSQAQAQTRQSNRQSNRQNNTQQSNRQTMNPNTAQGRRNRDEIKASVNESKTNWDYINTVIDSALSHNSLTAPLMKTIKSAKEPKTVQEQAQPKDTRTVTEKVGDFITSIPKGINERRTNRSYQFGMSDEEQEAIARERGASDEDIAQAKQAFAMNIDYINRNAQHGHTYEKMVENQMRTAGGLPMDSWLRFLPDDDGNIVDRSLNSARAGVLMHGQGLTGLQADIGNRLGADDYEEDRLKDFQYQQALTQQALSGDNQGAYDRIFANSVSNLLTGLETTALGQLGGMSLGTKALERIGLGNMAVNSFGNAYGNVRTGGMGEQYTDDVDAARRYAYASALNELGQEKMFDALGLISGGKITENTIPGANVFGLGSFMTEAAEEGAGALVDPFTEAALEGNIFSPEYWKRVGEIYGEQGLAGTLQNVRDSAIEGGLGGVMGGVMSNPVQSARQIATDVRGYANARKLSSALKWARQNSDENGIINAGQPKYLNQQAPNLNLAGASAKDSREIEFEAKTGSPNFKDGSYDYEKVDDGSLPIEMRGLERTRKIQGHADSLDGADDMLRRAFDAYTEFYIGDPNNDADLPVRSAKLGEEFLHLRAMRVALGEGALMSTSPKVRKDAQDANAFVVWDSIERCGANGAMNEVDPNVVNKLIGISNRVGVPFEFLPDSYFVKPDGARVGGWFAPGRHDKNGLRTGVIQLPISSANDVEDFIDVFLHEVTHTTEGTPEYYKLAEALKEIDGTVSEDYLMDMAFDPPSLDDYAKANLGVVYDKKGHLHRVKDISLGWQDIDEDMSEAEFTDTTTGEKVPMPHNTIAADPLHMHGNEHYANLVGNFVRNLVTDEKYGSLTERKKATFKDILAELGGENVALRNPISFLRDAMKNVATLDLTKETKRKAEKRIKRLLEDAMDASIFAETMGTVYDPRGHGQLKVEVNRVMRKGGTPVSTIPGRFNKDGTPMLVRDAVHLIDKGEQVPYDGVHEYLVPRYKKDPHKGYSSSWADFANGDVLGNHAITPKDLGNYSYKQDLKRTGLTEEDLENYAMEVTDAMDGDYESPVTKEAFEKIAKNDERAKKIGFETFKRMIDNYDVREELTDEENATMNAYAEENNDPYEEIDSYLSSQGIAKSYAERLGNDLRKKGDYSASTLEQGVRSLKNSKKISEEEARKLLTDFRDEYNKRHPEGLEAANKKAEAKAQKAQEEAQKAERKKKKNAEAEEQAAFNRLMAEDAREQRNAQNGKNQKLNYYFDSKGRLIDAATGKPVKNVKRTNLNEQSTSKQTDERKAYFTDSEIERIDAALKGGAIDEHEKEIVERAKKLQKTKWSVEFYKKVNDSFKNTVEEAYKEDDSITTESKEYKDFLQKMYDFAEYAQYDSSGGFDIDVLNAISDWNWNHPNAQIEAGETDTGFYIYDDSYTRETDVLDKIAEFTNSQNPSETEQKTETPRKTESQIYEETFNPTVKETKAETKKNEKVEETKTEENREEERKEETSKEETAEQQKVEYPLTEPSPTELAETLKSENSDDKFARILNEIDNPRAERTGNDEELNSVLAIAYYRLGASVEHANALADRKMSTGNSRTRYTPVMEDIMKEHPELTLKEAKALLANIHSRYNDMVKTAKSQRNKQGFTRQQAQNVETENVMDAETTVRQQAEESTNKGTLEQAMVSEPQNVAENKTEEPAKQETKQTSEKVEATAENSESKTILDTVAQMRTENNSTKKIEEYYKSLGMDDATAKEVAEFTTDGVKMEREGAGNAETLKRAANQIAQKGDMTYEDAFKQLVDAKKNSWDKSREILKERETTSKTNAENKVNQVKTATDDAVKKVNETAKKVKGKEFNEKDTETIKFAETRAEEKKEEKHERQQVKLEDFVAKQAEKMRQASSDRLNYAQDFTDSQTTAKFIKDKYWDEGLRARAEESHLIKAVKHDSDVKADASKWNDESGQGGVVAYAEAINRDNGYEPTEEEILYLIEGLKRANKLQQDIAQNIKRLENDKSKGAKEALSKMRDEQKYQMDACVTLFEAIKGDGSEAGRALRAMRYLYETPELIPVYMQRKLAQLNKKYAKQLKGREIKLDQDLLDKISDPNISDEERDDLWDKINYNLADQLPRTLSGRVTQWRKTGMLLNPRTHMRNIISNGLTYGMFRINDLTQAGIENFVLKHKAVQKILNTEYTQADRRAAARVDKDYMEAAVWLDKQHKYSREGDGGGKFNIFEGISEAGAFSNNNPVGRFLNKVARANNKALNTEDRWFVEGRAHRAMAEMLKAQGYKVEKKGSDFEITKDNKAIQPSVLEAIEREALKNAQEATYHDFNKAAKALENLKKSLGSAGYAIDIIVPFTKTPANIMRRSLEFSPVGLAKSVTKDLYKVRNGDMSASTYITRLSRGVTGTAAFIIGAVIANMGWLSKPDDDEDERTEYYEDNVYGKQDLALHIGDRYYSLDWAMPSSAPLMMGAAMANEFSKHGLNILDYDAKELLSDGAKALNPVLEASYLGSLSDFMTSFSQGVNYGGNVLPAGTLGGFERAGSSIVENLAGQMAPTIGGAINRTIDSTKRTTSGNTMGERMRNKFLMNAPFFSRMLQPAIDEKGNEIKNLGFISDDVIGRLIYNFATPMTITEDTHDKLDSALMSVGTNSKGVAVALPRNQTGTGGLKGQILSDLRDAGMNLSDISAKEYTQVKKTYYGNYREYAKAYNELAEYNHLGTHVRDDVYTKLEQLALAEAKATYYDKVGSTDDLYTKEQKAALALKAHGVSPAQFYLIKDCGLTGNRKALYVMSELENLGVADEVIDDIMHQKYFASAVGLSDSVVLKTADEREDARAKYLMEDGETLESMVANYRAQSNEAYKAKKESDSKKSEEESWNKFLEKADKKFGTHLSSGKGSKGSGSKGKSSGGRRRSSRKSSGGSSSTTTISTDEQKMYEKFFKAAGKALSIKGDLPSASVKVKFDDDSALWDRLVNASKSDVEKLRRELGIK